MDSSKTEKVVLLGKSGSGKDYLLRKLTEKGLKPGVKWTTRPPRKHEKQGITYNFVDWFTFQNSIVMDEFLCYQKFDVTPEGKEPETWYYGLTKEEFNQSQAFIMTPGEFEILTPELRKGCFIVYLDIDRDGMIDLFFIQDSNLYVYYNTHLRKEIVYGLGESYLCLQ